MNPNNDFGSSLDLLLHAASSAGSDVETTGSSPAAEAHVGHPLQPHPKLARMDTPANPNNSGGDPLHRLYAGPNPQATGNVNMLDHMQARGKLPGLLECGLLMRSGQYNQGGATMQGSSRISIPALLNGLPPALQTLRAQVVRQVYEIASKPLSATSRSYSSSSTVNQHMLSSSHSTTPLHSGSNSPTGSSRHNLSGSSSASGMHVCGHVGCGKAFPSRSRLQRHLIVHTNEKPFMCPQEGCGRRFSRRDNMLQHYKSHKISRRH